MIEDEIIGLSECLTAEGMPGLSGPLVDKEGFPRDDIDIPQVRTMRGRIACLQTDLSSLMKKIEQSLAQLHQAYRDHKLVQEDGAAGESVS